MPQIADTRTIAEIYKNHPLADIILKSIATEPGAATSDDFKKGFYAALAVVHLQGAAVLEDYTVQEKSPLDIRIEEMKNGGSISAQSREIDGKFQQRSVLTGPWETVEKPSGLTDPS